MSRTDTIKVSCVVLRRKIKPPTDLNFSNLYGVNALTSAMLAAISLPRAQDLLHIGRRQIYSVEVGIKIPKTTPRMQESK